MRFLSQLLLLLVLCVSGWAIHESDVGIVDWHKKLIGVPLSGSIVTAPTFHATGNTTVVITATDNNVLAVLDPEDGSVLWRYILDPEDQIAGFYKSKDCVAVLSGPGGATLRTFDALHGHLIVEKQLHAPQLAVLSEPHYLGKFVAFNPQSRDLYVLTNGYTVSCIDGDTGGVKWTWSSPDQTSLVIHTHLLFTNDAIYAVGAAKSFASYTLHVAVLSPTTGELLASANLPSSIANPLREIMVLTCNDTDSTHAIWLENGLVKSLVLTPKLSNKPSTIEGAGYAQILDVGLSKYGQLVATREDGASRILKLDEDGLSLASIWQFENSAHSKDNTDSIYAGGLDGLGRPYVSRVFWSHKYEKGSADIFAAHLETGTELGAFFPFDTKSHGIINHVAMDASHTPSGGVIARLLVTTSSGAIQLWQQGELKWMREESLATTTLAEFVELPERVASGSNLHIGGEGFVSRVIRQISDAQDFPQYVFNFVKRFVTGSYASASSPASVPSSANETLSRDAFGFRQVIVAATAFGKVFGIDSSNGEILWSRVLGLGWAAEIGGRIHPVKLYLTRTVSDGGDPEVVLVTQRRADNTLVDTVLFHINAVNGEDVRRASKKSDLFEGLDIIQGPLVEGFLLQTEPKAVVLLDEFLRAYLYPNNAATQAAFAKVSSALSFPLRTNAEGRQRIQGHQILLKSELSDKPVAYTTWSLNLPPSESIQQLLPPASRGPVASIGRVLGNRTTLYKYLNPRLFTVLTVSPTTNMCGLYVVDSTKGTVVYHVQIKGHGGCNIKTALTENWLVYHYFEGEVADGSVDGAKGYRMVTVELYEGEVVDEKTSSSDMSSFSEKSLHLTAYEQAFVFPHPITALAPTSTKFGISSKDLIVATRNHRIQSFQRAMLNPRRPKRKVTAEEAEEFLVEYDPVLPDDPHRVLSHDYEVANVQRIVTAPALLESTSLVFAFGLDMFLTRVAPSNTFDVLSENFNKAQLVFTVSGLLLAIMITRPMVERKRLREKWYQ
ncbi:hypothetical protein K443DRAFT_550803 [Laccaria amethystina LaAM-08-1]|uniref:ER membrane protein complex subunit 1 n=1 Tax=Laccaria amethystina LaAM-08-1 TaxID=1095629 RepID=A0A0C9WSF1_9AGAR|nr:hypothetical protein K443DRAFT_550803 [Laccaria amethystina LaAM-08-1]